MEPAKNQPGTRRGELVAEYERILHEIDETAKKIDDLKKKP